MKRQIRSIIGFTLYHIGYPFIQHKAASGTLFGRTIYYIAPSDAPGGTRIFDF